MTCNEPGADPCDEVRNTYMEFDDYLIDSPSIVWYYDDGTAVSILHDSVTPGFPAAYGVAGTGAYPECIDQGSEVCQDGVEANSISEDLMLDDTADYRPTVTFTTGPVVVTDPNLPGGGASYKGACDVTGPCEIGPRQ